MNKHEPLRLAEEGTIYALLVPPPLTPCKFLTNLAFWDILPAILFPPLHGGDAFTWGGG